MAATLIARKSLASMRLYRDNKFGKGSVKNDVAGSFHDSHVERWVQLPLFVVVEAEVERLK